MVSAWWLLLVFLLGGSAGMLGMALMVMARDVPKVQVRTRVLRVTLP